MIYGWLRVWKYLGKLGVCKFWVFPFGIRFALGIKRDQRDSDIEFLTKIWVDSSNYWRKYCFTFPDLLIKVATVQMSDYEAFQILDLSTFAIFSREKLSKISLEQKFGGLEFKVDEKQFDPRILRVLAFDENVLVSVDEIGTIRFVTNKLYCLIERSNTKYNFQVA